MSSPPRSGQAAPPIAAHRSAAFRLQEETLGSQAGRILPSVSSAAILQPEGCPPRPWQLRQNAYALWGVLGLLVAAGGLVLFCFDPRQYHFYPVCFFHQTTGLLCPGCGALRAAHQLLHGHLASAFRFNPILIVSLPMLAWFATRVGLQKPANQPASLAVRPLWLWLVLVAVLVVSVLRNLPGAPFAVLRP